MIIKEQVAGAIITFEFILYKKVVLSKHYMLNYHTENELYRVRCKVIEEVDQMDGRFKGRKKDLIKAFAQLDERFNDLYAELYPHGGYHGGGRPRGSKTDKTERFQQAISLKEKIYLEKCLIKFREREEKKRQKKTGSK